MDKTGINEYKYTLNTYVRSIIKRGIKIYQGSIEESSKRIGIHSTLSEIYSKVLKKTYPHIYQTGFKEETIKFHINSLPERDRASSLKYIVLDRIYENLDQNDIFFDIGAGIGTLSCAVGCHLSRGRVYAFEPLPANVRAIHRNFDQNSIEGDVFQCALSDTETEVTFTIPDQSVGAGYTNAALLPEYTDSNFWDDKTEDIKVRAKTGDRLIKNGEIPIPNIIAIDVEGAEMEVIQGLRSTLANNECRVVFCEVHEYLLSDFGTSSEQLENELRTLGFNVETFDRRKYEMGGEQKSLYRIEAYK
jgi:FkbM family methyltransferase